jgi:nucleolar protein TMA23
MSDKKNKRKRQADDAPQEVKKAKKADAKSEKTAQTANKSKAATTQELNPVARKIAKLSPRKKAGYEQRAAAKNQTIDEYISRRIEKKAAKRAATRLDKPATAPAPFFTDLEGDATLLQPTTPVTPAQPVLGAVQEAPSDEASGPPEADTVKPKKIRRADLPSDVPSGKKAYKTKVREKRKTKRGEEGVQGDCEG